MTADQLPAAAELRARQGTAQRLRAEYDLSSLAAKLHAAAGTGDRFIRTATLSQYAEQALEKKGYKIEFIVYGPDTPPHYVISW